MLVLCSRNARPQKGLVRRPHVDQHGCPSKREKQASLEGPLFDGKMCSFDARSKGQGLRRSLRFEIRVLARVA